MKVAIIGAGASGLMLGGLLVKKSFDVTIFDHNEKAGKKLFITGKGRCNITNLCDETEFLKNVVRGGKFLTSALYSFNSYDTVEFFNNLNLKTKAERGNRVFPESDKASDVIKALLKHCEGVNFLYNQNVTDVKVEVDEEQKFAVIANGKEHVFDKVVIATGGASYKATGSDGSGYKIAKSLGHTVEEIKPALCPMKLNDDVSSLMGLSLKNVTLKAKFDNKSKEFFGEMMFTGDGITGPIVLSLSSYINRAKSVELILDLKPALTLEQLDARLLRDFEANKNKNISYIFKGLMPSSLVPFFAKKCGVDESKKVHDILKEERRKISETLKNLPLSFKSLYPLDAGIITSGGVALDEINPKTFESKFVENLYFIGEVLDIDALTGGFNLQIAFSTAYKCGLGQTPIEK